MILDRLPESIRRRLYAGGSRRDRLRDPDAVIRVLDLRPGMIVADLGPGVGHFTLRMARAGDLLVVLPTDVEGVWRQIVTFDPSQGPVQEVLNPERVAG